MKNKLLTIFVLLFYLLLTLPSVFSEKHLLFNLEPYPDGLFYSLSAKNFIENGRLALEYNGVRANISQPPLYSLILSLGYLIWNNPRSYYLINMVLMISPALIILKIIIIHSKNTFTKICSIIFFSLHAYLYWLPSVPMTENLAFFLIAVCLYFITKKNYSKKDFLLTLIFGLLLTLSRLAIIPMSITLITIGFYRILKNSDDNLKRKYFLLAIIMAIGINVLFSFFLEKSLLDYFIYFFKQTFYPNDVIKFYDISNFNNNIISYAKTLLGYKSSFLWLTNPLTSVWITFAIILNIIDGNKKEILLKVMPLMTVFISQFFLLLSFYLTDSRYILYSIILLTLIYSISVPKKPSVLYKIFVVAFIFFHFLNQIPLFKNIISENIFHKSVAWQYESVKVIDKFFKNNDYSFLITSLPPHFIDAYSNNKIILLPMSHSQEFLQKKEYPWGNEIDYENLSDYYANLLVAKKEVYISNAYITHQQSVINDYEIFKKEFDLELFSSGCLEACNIYKLSLKE